MDLEFGRGMVDLLGVVFGVLWVSISLFEGRYGT